MTIHRCVQPKYQHEDWTLFYFFFFSSFFFFFFLFFSFFSFFFFFFFFFSFFFFFFLFFFVGSRPLLFLLISIHRALLLCCVFTWPLLEDLPVGLASPIPTTLGRPQVLRGGLLSFSSWGFGRPGLGDPLRLAHEARHAPVVCFAVPRIPPLEGLGRPR